MLFNSHFCLHFAVNFDGCWEFVFQFANFLEMKFCVCLLPHKFSLLEILYIMRVVSEVLGFFVVCNRSVFMYQYTFVDNNYSTMYIGDKTKTQNMWNCLGLKVKDITICY